LVMPDSISADARKGRPTLAARLDEATPAVHQVSGVRAALTLGGGWAVSTILPATVCVGWVAVGLGLELWAWFAARPPSPERPATSRSRANFAINFAAVNLWWLALAALIWRTGSVEAHAAATVVVATLCAVAVLLVYTAPWVFLAAGAAPAIGALLMLAEADGREMWPIWVMLALSAVFCVGRALKTPSTQESERRLKASLRDFEVLAENVSEVITRTNVSGIREYVSPGCLAMLGYRPEELIGTPASEGIHPKDLPMLEASKRRMIANPHRSETVTVRVRHKNGRWLWLQSSAKIICEDGVPVGLIGVSRDVSEQVADEKALFEAKVEAEAANRAKAEFLANVSHEIRTPMNGVLGALHLIERESISPEGRELIRQANDCGRMLSQLLNDVLDFSKIDAGQLDLSPEPMTVGEALQGVIALVGGQARAKGVELRCEIEGGDLWIEADPVRVRQAMFNLLGNAAKFTHAGHVVARLSVTPAGEGRRQVRFEVEDTGIGMSAKAQAHLFERFRQAEGATARRFGGTGLGLSITRALARLMGGKITVASVEGEGSTFTLTFEAPAAGPAVLQPERDALLEGVRILLVEDNPTNRLVARTMLTRLGASVDEAVDGVAGLLAARAGLHDLILMDVQMPHLDGIECTRAIRGLKGAAARIPIIGLTANVMVHQRAEYLGVGMNGVVAKPISPASLIAEIARVVAATDDEAARGRPAAKAG
jgi:PAS domain S-box-containing protein